MKYIKEFAVLTCALAITTQAATLRWGTASSFEIFQSGPDIIKADGNALEYGSGYYMYLFRDSLPTVQEIEGLNSAALSTTPILTDSTVTEDYKDFTLGDGDAIFMGSNSSTTGSDKPGDANTFQALLISADATSQIVGEYDYILFSSETFTQPALPVAEFTYDLGTVSQGDWTAIPEPSTMLLGGIGLLGLWIRRRMSK